MKPIVTRYCYKIYPVSFGYLLLYRHDE